MTEVSAKAKVLAFIWNIILIGLPTMLLSFISEKSTSAFVLAVMLTSLVVTLVLLLITYIIFRRLGTHNEIGNYLLSVGIAITIYHVVAALGVIANMRFGLSDEAFTFIQPALILLGCILAIRHYKLNLNLSWRLWEGRQLLRSVVWGILFGVIFYFLKEPAVSLYSNTLGIIVVYTLLVGVSEELLFRFVVFRLAEKAFGNRLALWVQAVVFAAMHFIYFNFILRYYSQVGTVLAQTAALSTIIYFLALVWFGHKCGKLVGVRQNETQWAQGNIVYAIIVHWLTNLVTLAMISFLPRFL